MAGANYLGAIKKYNMYICRKVMVSADLTLTLNKYSANGRT